MTGDETRPRPRIVIVGGGFGGLEAAKGLAALDADITLIDRQNHHCFQPLLYQVATAVLSPADVAWPIRSILRPYRNITVLMRTVTGVDTANRRVLTDGQDVPYDHLVLATGATHSYFGRDDWAEAAPGLKRIEDATRLRRRILLAFEQAESTDDLAERRRLLTFIVIGGGPTGVEMVGAISEITRVLPPDFRRCNPRDARVILIEAGPRILPAFEPRLSDYARRSLEKMGVEIMTGTRVTDCTAEGVDTDHAPIAARTLVWAAGVTASPAGEWLGVERDRAGRVMVAPDLRVPGHPEIFVIGDTASVATREGRPVPGIAPAAKQMGHYAAKAIAAEVSGQPAPAPFAYDHQGDLATIGYTSAVVKLKHVTMTGFLAWVLWGVVHIYFLIGLRYRIAVGFKWLWDYLTFKRGARLITTSTGDREPEGHGAALRDTRPDELPPGVTRLRAHQP